MLGVDANFLTEDISPGVPDIEEEVLEVKMCAGCFHCSLFILTPQ